MLCLKQSYHGIICPGTEYTIQKIIEKEVSVTKAQNKRASFLSGVLVLTVANIITKIIGMVFKIPLTNMLGDEGMGYFNTAYQIYTWLYMISTAGLPVALSLMISECNAKGEHAKTKKIFTVCLTAFLLLGALGTALMMIFCRPLAHFISADLAYLCILSIAPALFLICICSTIRGFFQGHRNMLPTAVSEIIEAVGKLSIGIALGGYALSKGFEIHIVASCAIFGVTAGIAAETIFLLLFSAISRKQRADIDFPPCNDSYASLFGAFLKIAVPVMLSSSLLSMSSMLDTLIVIRRMCDFGLTEKAAVAYYGNYTSYCVTLFNLPPALIYPIVSTLIPSVSASRARGDKEKTKLLINKSLKLASVIALPCAMGLAVMSGPILRLIFSNAESAEMASPLLTTLAPSVFLIGIMAVTNGALQAYRLQRYTLISMLAGALVKAASVYLLVGVKVGDGRLLMYASPISTFLFYLTITLFNIFFLVQKTELRPNFIKMFSRPFVSSLLCALSAVGSYSLFTNFGGESKLFTLTAIALASAVYGISLILLGGITKEDIRLIPKAEKLACKIPFLR